LDHLTADETILICDDDQMRDTLTAILKRITA
jgi:hypothetical protein